MDVNKLRLFDAANYIETPRDVRLFLREVRVTNQMDELREALVLVSRARRRMRRQARRGR